jgi:DNA-binding NtrC family response regulator
MQKTLLIVDNDSAIREILGETLKVLGAKIFLATDGLEALGVIQENKITAILSDVNMPNMRGTELLRKIRDLGYLTPFVILTAYGDKKMAVEALRLGAFDFIDKPWCIEKLFSTTEKVLEIGSEIAFWENEVDIQRLVFSYQDENSKRIIAALIREDGFDFKKKL